MGFNFQHKHLYCEKHRMRDEDKTKEHLTTELEELRQRLD